MKIPSQEVVERLEGVTNMKVELCVERVENSMFSNIRCDPNFNM